MSDETGETRQATSEQELLKNIDLSPSAAAWGEFDKIGAIRHETSQNFPTEIDETKLVGIDDGQASLLGSAFDGYVSFLKRPIITDRFQNHTDRHIWRTQAESRMTFLDQKDGKGETDRKKTFTEIYKSNRLNVNSLFELPGYTEMLLDDPDNLPAGFPLDALKKISSLSKHFTTEAKNNVDFIKNPNPWDTLPLENTKDDKGNIRLGKLAVLHQLEESIHQVVNFLGKH